jgi:hypothetical protein
MEIGVVFQCFPNIYTWILLIVEISTPKPKSINFAKSIQIEEKNIKKTPEGLFPLQNVFFTPECFGHRVPPGRRVWQLCASVKFQAFCHPSMGIKSSSSAETSVGYC